MKWKSWFLIGVVWVFFSCEKEEQSCSDGVFQPDYEEATDCGGVCPPCEEDTNQVVNNYLVTKINGKPTSFSNVEIVKSAFWVMNFKNDSIDVSLNFGGIDTLGMRSIKTSQTSAVVNQVPYATFDGGFVIFDQVDMDEKLLSGYFEAKFYSVVDDTLEITAGQFEDFKWVPATAP